MSKVAPGYISNERVKSPMETLLTGVVDEDVENARALCHLSNGLLDGCIIVDVEGKRFDGVLRFRTLALNAPHGVGSLLIGTSCTQDMVWLLGLEEDLASLVANTAVAACDEDDFRLTSGTHCAESVADGVSNS